MSRKQKRPLPPRALRMDRAARLQSARHWLATQRGRPAARGASSYRKRFGVDWPCAIAELTLLGIAIDAKWREQLARMLEGARQAKARRRTDKETAGRCGRSATHLFALPKPRPGLHTVSHAETQDQVV